MAKSENFQPVKQLREDCLKIILKASPKLPKRKKKKGWVEEGWATGRKEIRKEINFSQHQWNKEVPVHWNVTLFMLQGLLE